MNPFQQRAAIRIAAVSLVLASIASPASWFVAREKAEESVVSLAIEESGRLLHHYDAINLAGPDAARNQVGGGGLDLGDQFAVAEDAVAVEQGGMTLAILKNFTNCILTIKSFLILKTKKL